jgi:hypothetical protein
MTFNTTSFLAGVGTMFAAVALGFAGGAMITTSPKVEQNRLERVAGASMTPVVAARAVTAVVPPATAAKSDVTETPAADRVIPMTSAATAPAATAQAMPVPSALTSAPPQPVMVRDEATSQVDSAKKLRESELRKEAELRKAERRAERRERRKHQDIEAAANAVRQMQRDGGIQVISQRDESPRLGFFGND